MPLLHRGGRRSTRVQEANPNEGEVGAPEAAAAPDDRVYSAKLPVVERLQADVHQEGAQAHRQADEDCKHHSWFSPTDV